MARGNRMATVAQVKATRRRAAPSTLTCDAVIAAVVLGRVVRLTLTSEQKRMLRDREGQLALHLLRHALAARAAACAPQTPPADFPFTTDFVHDLARTLDQPIGTKRARDLRRRLTDRLLAAHVIEHYGSYRQPDAYKAGDGTHRVTLYRLAVSVPGHVRARKRRAPGTTSASVGSGRAVKPWWKHPLFGFGDPECVRSYAELLREWKEPPDWAVPWTYEGDF